MEIFVRVQHSSLQRQRQDYGLKTFAMLRTGANVIKLFTTVSYNFLQLARALVPGKPFQPNLMFADKARAYLSEVPFLDRLQGLTYKC